MALLVLLFLDLATLPQSQGDDALYRQALADHPHLGSNYAISLDGSVCVKVARNSSDLGQLGTALELAARRGQRHLHKTHTLFSNIGWEGTRALVQLTADGETSCLVYRRSGASYRLVREIRLMAQ